MKKVRAIKFLSIALLIIFYKNNLKLLYLNNRHMHGNLVCVYIYICVYEHGKHI